MKTLAAALLFALITQTPQLPKPTFETGVDIIQVDVHVVDKTGKPIADLRPDEFEVEISGKKRKISTVQFISYASPPSPRVAQPGTDVASRPRRLFLLAIDEHSLHISNALAGIEAAERFIDKLQPDDLVGLQAFPTGRARHDFTTDHAAVKKALRGVTGLHEEPSSRFNLTPSEVIDIANGDRDVQMRIFQQHCARGGCTLNDVRNDAISLVGFMEMKVSQSVNALRNLVRGLGDVPGRKTVVLVSGGLVASDHAGGRVNAKAELASLGRETALANVSLFALHLDWSFLTSLGSKGGLRGSYFRDSNMAASGLEIAAGVAGGAVMRVQGTSPNVAFDRVLTETSAHYLLGVAGDEADRDGRTHTIRVTVKRGGAQVRSRTEVRIPKQASR
jgi:VWFA-related protein